jgi:hypothetical protein
MMQEHSMKTRFLAWYISALLGLSCAAYSLISLAPGENAERERITAQAVLAVGALVFAALGTTSSFLSLAHWINRSRLLRVVLLILASFCTFFFAMMEG